VSSTAILTPVPRRLREEAAGAFHHVVSKGNGGAAIVHDDRDRRTFVSRLGRAVERHRWICLAYCLLDNHFHLVLQTPEPNLGTGMQWLQSAYAQDIKHRHKHKGHVFGGRFYSVRLADDEHLVSALVYVWLNPVRAGVAKRPDGWSWCSYAATVGFDSAPPFLARRAVLELFDLRPHAAPRVLADAVAATLERDGASGLRGQTRRVRPRMRASGVATYGSDPACERQNRDGKGVRPHGSDPASTGRSRGRCGRDAATNGVRPVGSDPQPGPLRPDSRVPSAGA
jgi:REP element-mobilizing transposase RayT